ncbi:MAG: ExbD/TolR family protein [Planctomycetota bacterium]
MTPIIDIVFLLIIFFLVVCRFIEAENFPVAVPDDCRFARGDSESGPAAATVSVMMKAGHEIGFAVGSQAVSPLEDADGMIEELARLIDERLSRLPPEQRLVTLRIDKDICFAEAQYALAGIAASCAANVQLAAFKDKHIGSP